MNGHDFAARETVMKKLTIRVASAPKSLIDLGAVKAETKGSAEQDQDGSQNQKRDPFGLTND